MIISKRLGVDDCQQCQSLVPVTLTYYNFFLFTKLVIRCNHCHSKIEVSAKQNAPGNGHVEIVED